MTTAMILLSELQVKQLEAVQMETLNLSRNEISEIVPCAFCPCLKLTHLDLSHNLLTDIDLAFGEEDSKYENIKFLDVSHNMIQVEVKTIFPFELSRKTFVLGN